MKVLVFVKATPNSEKGLPPAAEMEKMFIEMGKFNEALIDAGIMQDADGLKPSSGGRRVKFSNGNVTVVNGPFANPEDLVAGYWVWNVKSLDEAMEWAKRCPNPMPGEEGVLEIRPTYAMEDFGEAATEQVREQETKLRRKSASLQKEKAKLSAKPATKRKSVAKRKPAAAKKPAKRKPTRAKSKK